MRAFLSLIVVLASQWAWAGYSFSGIGATLRQSGQHFQIVEVLLETPADRAGLQKDEVITAVDGRPTAGLSMNDVVGQIRGLTGTNVVLTLAKSEIEFRDLRLTRDLVTVDCFLEGAVQLTLSGDFNAGSLMGSIGNDQINLNVSMNRVSGFIKNQSVNFDINATPGSVSYTITGWIGSTRVQWQGNGNQVFDYQQCIP